MTWALGDYATLEDVRAEINLKEANTASDAALEAYITEASRMIDAFCGGRRFYGTVETHYFDAEQDIADDGRTLLVDDDLSGVVSITLGDGSTLSASDFVLKPANLTPKFAVTILRSSTKSWAHYVTDSENSIALNGTWGYVPGTVPPEDIRRAAISLVRWMFHRKRAQPESGVGGDKGAYNVSSDLPQEIQAGLIYYVRRRFGAA